MGRVGLHARLYPASVGQVNKPRTPKSILQKWANGGNTPFSPEQIMEGVVRVTGVKQDMILGSARYRHIVRARHLWWAGLRHYCQLSYPEIGLLDGKDHTTIMSGVRNVPDEVVKALGEYCEQPD